MTIRYAATVKICPAQHVVGRRCNRCSLVLSRVVRRTPIERGLLAAIRLTTAGALILNVIQATRRACLFQLVEPSAPQAFWPRTHQCEVVNRWRVHTLALFSQRLSVNLNRTRTGMSGPADEVVTYSGTDTGDDSSGLSPIFRGTNEPGWWSVIGATTTVFHRVLALS